VKTMSSVSVSNRFPPLLASIVPINGLVTTALLTVLGSMVLALSAKIQIPFWPVPMTMQTLVVLMLSMAYGSRLALGTLLLYMAEGAAGLPVFAGANAGLAYISGPTGGYQSVDKLPRPP
jgi:biotin transport system substrate-specific component